MSAEVAETLQVSDKLLLEEFRAFAGRNALFRRGKLDSVELNVIEGEVVEDVDDMRDVVSVEYYFSAHRLRLPADEDEIRADVDKLPEPRTFTVFKLGVVAMMQQTSLPPQVAEQAKAKDRLEIDVDPEVNRFDIFHRLEFMTSTNEHWLRTTESYEYLDDEGNVIHEATTGIVDDEPDDNLPEGAVLLTRSERQQQEAELKDWLKTTGMIIVDVELANEQHDEQLRAAYEVFGSFKRALACYH